MAITFSDAIALLTNNPSQYGTPQALDALARQVSISALDSNGQPIDYTGKGCTSQIAGAGSSSMALWA